MSTNAGTSPPPEGPPPTETSPDEAVEPKGTKTDAPPKLDKSTEKEPPWRAEFAKRGIDDPDGRLDAYMREVSQPYTTKVEQEAAEWKQMFGGDKEIAGIASKIMAGLDADPVGTLKEIATLLNVDLAGDDTKPEGAPPADGEEELTDPLKGLDGEDAHDKEVDPRQKWIDEKMEREAMEKADEEYRGLLKQIGGVIPDFNEKLYSYMVMAAGGDYMRAVDMYEDFVKDHPPAPKPVAPPVIGGSGGTPAPKPEKDYNGDIGAAIDDYLAQQEAAERR